MNSGIDNIKEAVYNMPKYAVHTPPYASGQMQEDEYGKYLKLSEVLELLDNFKE